jgi:hypothetical protein
VTLPPTNRFEAAALNPGTARLVNHGLVFVAERGIGLKDVLEA